METLPAVIGRILRASSLIPAGASLLLVSMPLPAIATDIFGIQNAALDQPQVNILLRRPPAFDIVNGTSPFGDSTFNIQAFLDTGSSGVILSEQTADGFGISRSPGVVFEDVGIGGASQFHVSEPLRIDMAPFTPFVDLDNPSSAASVYNQSSGPLRTQIGPLGADPSLGNVDIVGMPTLQGKVVVMDPKPLNTLLESMRTYVYNPGTPFRPATAESDPGIPQADRAVALTFAAFDRFTNTTPSNAEGPTLSANPFIGPNPLSRIDANTPPGTNPGITLRLGDKETTGSLLLDTGSPVSMISSELAANLNVRYRLGEATPTLEVFDPANPAAPGTVLADQFILTVGGIGGEHTAAGFFLDSMLLRTKQGNPLNDDDPAHLRYVRAPVLVSDISLLDPDTQDALTLDGIFAMNYLVTSVFFSEPFILGEINASPFDWIVFDAQTGELRFDLVVPEPQAHVFVALGLAALGWRLSTARQHPG